MTVHIGEVHTEVVPADGPAPPTPAPERDAAPRWEAARVRREALRARVRAESFDD